MPCAISSESVDCLWRRAFFFPPNTRYLALTEVRLNDKNGKSARNIDMVLVALDDNDEIVDFGALEVQAVYISGNVKKPFKYGNTPAKPD